MHTPVFKLQRTYALSKQCQFNTQQTACSRYARVSGISEVKVSEYDSAMDSDAAIDRDAAERDATSSFLHELKISRHSFLALEQLLGSGVQQSEQSETCNRFQPEYDSKMTQQKDVLDLFPP